MTSTHRLWDLRRGDADDDRTSPYGRGWTSMVISTALEFNYLTASLAFLTLIILPAVVLGLVPPLIATYGQHKFTAWTTTEGPTLVSLGVLVLLVTLAIRLGRPVVAATVDSFWQLQYTLIFPLFIGLRELISAGLEHLPGATNTPEQFDHRRRAGTIVAAILLAGGGLVLAGAVEFSSGMRLIKIADARVWTLTNAALRNGFVILCLSTVVASLYWFWRELTASRPILNWVPNPAAAGTSSVRVAHLSDLHLVGERFGYRMETGTHGPRGNRRVRRALRQLVALHAATPLDRVLVTGDITDAGTRAEWIEFLDLLRGCPELRTRMLFVPGNHDVNVVDRTNTGRLDLPGSLGQALRELRVVLALDAIQGQTVRVVDRKAGALGPTLHDYLQQGERPVLLRELAEQGSRRGRREMRKLWERIFPLVSPPTRSGGYGVILLDSNARRHFSLTNAIGVIGRSQLAALRSILRSSGDTPWLVLLHHHVVEYPIPSIGLKERIGLSLANAPDVLAAFASHGAPVIVMHGHRHRDWIGTRGEVVLCSAPSACFGSYNSDSDHGYLHVYELGFTADGGVRLNASESVAVA